MSTAAIYEAVIAAAQRGFAPGEKLRHLDIGAGRGELIRRMRGRLAAASSACDFHVENFALQDVKVDQVNLNGAPLPYADASFDLVTCSEVVEHLESYRALFREVRRVLRPGGVFVVTTPNVLNALSRMRYLASGFANLFGPLPVRNEKLYSTGGHITPIPYFYLAHALLDAGFHRLELSIDRVQRTSVLLAVLLSPLILPAWLRFWRREERKYRTLSDENRPHVARHLSWDVLVGRTIVVSARRGTDIASR